MRYDIAQQVGPKCAIIPCQPRCTQNHDIVGSPHTNLDWMTKAHGVFHDKALNSIVVLNITNEI
jgi:hypothetical protein